MNPPDSPTPLESWLELPEGRTFWLHGPCTIGRQPNNDLVIDLPALSRHHALLAVDGAHYTLNDLQSRNGTFARATRVTRPVALRDGDEIRFGDVKARYRCTRPVEPTGAKADGAPAPRLNQGRERGCWLALADVVAYTALNEKIGPEAAVRRRQAWITELRPLIEQHGGHINSYFGDGIFAYWLTDMVQPARLLRVLRAIELWRPRSPLAFRLVAHHGKALFTSGDHGEELTGREVNFVFLIEKIAKGFEAPAMLSLAAVQALELEGRCECYGRSGLEDTKGFFSFYALPRELTAPAAPG